SHKTRHTIHWQQFRYKGKRIFIHKIIAIHTMDMDIYKTWTNKALDLINRNIIASWGSPHKSYFFISNLNKHVFIYCSTGYDVTLQIIHGTPHIFKKKAYIMGAGVNWDKIDNSHQDAY